MYSDKAKHHWKNKEKTIESIGTPTPKIENRD